MSSDIAKALELREGVWEDACSPVFLPIGAMSPLGRRKRILVYSFSTLLSLSVLVLMASVTFGSFGRVELKVLVTTAAITGASICSFCCSVYTSRTRHFMPGFCGIGLTVLSGGMLILGVWLEPEGDAYWKTTVVLGVFAIACVHALALLAVRLRPEHRWLPVIASISIFFLGAVVSGMFLGTIDGAEDTLRLIVALSIPIAAETLLVPVLGWMGKDRGGQASASLLLSPRGDGLYEDGDGRIYIVKEKIGGAINLSAEGVVRDEP